MVSAIGSGAGAAFSPESSEVGKTGAPRRPGELSPEDQQAVEELKRRDREVRAHESAHLALAGAYARGGPTYTYQTGPDGQRYAVGGEVQLDAGKEANPRETIRKAQAVRAAAMAPADPSAQDYAVASAMASLELSARQELQQQQAQEAEKAKGDHPEAAGKESEATGQAPAVGGGKAVAPDVPGSAAKEDVPATTETTRNTLENLYRRSNAPVAVPQISLFA